MALTETQRAIEQILLSTDSASLPDLPNKPDKTNWVEKSGGLPKYIERIAKHLRSEQGMDTSKAIASAVNTVKRWCAGGDDVKPDTQTKACAAVAEWEKKKAGTKKNLSVGRLPGEPERWRFAHGTILSVADVEHIDSLEVVEYAEGFDAERYELALSAARLDLAVTTFDPQAHPRDYKGQFKKTLESLKQAESVKLPDGTTVTAIASKTKSGQVGGFSVNGMGKETKGGHVKNLTAKDAAEMALKESTSAGPKGQLPDTLPDGHKNHPGATTSGSMDHKDYMDGLTPEQEAEVAALGEPGKQRYGALRQKMPRNYSVATAHKTALKGAKEHDDFAKAHPFPGAKKPAAKPSAKPAAEPAGLDWGQYGTRDNYVQAAEEFLNGEVDALGGEDPGGDYLTHEVGQLLVDQLTAPGEKGPKVEVIPGGVRLPDGTEITTDGFNVEVTKP